MPRCPFYTEARYTSDRAALQLRGARVLQMLCVVTFRTSPTPRVHIHQQRLNCRQILFVTLEVLTCYRLLNEIGSNANHVIAVALTTKTRNKVKTQKGEHLRVLVVLSSSIVSDRAYHHPPGPLEGVWCLVINRVGCSDFLQTDTLWAFLSSYEPPCEVPGAPSELKRWVRPKLRCGDPSLIEARDQSSLL